MSVADLTIGAPEFDDGKARRNAFVLAVAHALFSCTAINIYITAGLIGTAIAPSLSWATLPISTYVVGTAISTIPASMLMRRIGRRPGFLVGVCFGIGGAALCAYSVWIANFYLFITATFIQGVYQAFIGYYRFAAADLASPSFKPKAISWVMVGGIAGATFGPMIVILTRDLFDPVMFVGNFVASVVLSLIAFGVLCFVDIPHKPEELDTSDARPLPEILKQPRLLTAILCGMLTYGMMNLLMTSAPIAMVACGFTVDDSAWAIQWHALAMFVPSFFTGHLIARFGVERIIAAGMVLLASAAIMGLSGVTFANFSIGLIALGLGWNFGFIGGTTMVTQCYRPSEKNKVQAINDFAVFTTVATASLTSGKLMAFLGWDAVNWAVFPMVGLVCVCLLSLALLSRKPAAT